MKPIISPRILLGVVIPAILACPLYGRVIRVPPTDKLVEKADLVVIARVTATTDAKKSDPAPKDFEGRVGVDTEFKVLAVLKGKLAGKTLTLFHFRQKVPGGVSQSPEIDGPGLVQFDPKEKDGRVRYLLFLTKRPDGRYEGVSGQVDPEYSVSKLDGPDLDK